MLLPYRWGTHSGLLEAAHDLGTPVLAPAFGGFGDQGATTYDDAAIGLRALRRAAHPRPTADSRAASGDDQRHAHALSRSRRRRVRGAAAGLGGMT